MRRRATYDDLRAVPDHLVAEIIEGELYTEPRPAPPHAVAGAGIGADLLAPLMRGIGGPGGWWILYEPELHLGQEVVVPDWAGWRRERMPAVPDTPFFAIAPDWACEIVSPHSGGKDRVKKTRIYAREGVGHLWLVDPLQRTLEVMRIEAGRWLIVGAFEGDATVRAEPFESIEIELGRWWLPEPPPPYP